MVTQIAPELREAVSRWRRVCVAIAILLPLTAITEMLLIDVLAGNRWVAAYFDWAGIEPEEIRFSSSEILGVWVFDVIFYDWPFFLLAYLAGKNVRQNWTPQRVSYAAIGGLVALTAPYLFFYSITPVDFQGRGVGAAYIMVFIAPLFGSILAVVGWLLGAWIGRRLSSVD